MIQLLKTILVLLASLVWASSGWASSPLAFEDDEGCLMCHKYPMMGRITKEGVFRSYTVVPEEYEATVHRNVPCRDCHTTIKELPHEPVTTGVTCDTECHSIKNPATGKPFSHKIIYDTYRESIHGRDKTEDGTDSDKPYCVYCHTNPKYNPDEDRPPQNILDRCVVCHEDPEFVTRWYNHTSRRIREVKRSAPDIVALCSSCHGDEEFIERRLALAESEGRELGEKFAYSIESFNESIHGKLTHLGSAETPNCLSCHAGQENYYQSVHEILPSDDPESPVNKSNRLQTCRQCHVYADDNYSALDPHPAKGKWSDNFGRYAELIYNIMAYTAIIGLVSLSLFETVGRWRDGVGWRIRRGTSWRRTRRKPGRPGKKS